jgi:hypothetical protein
MAIEEVLVEHGVVVGEGFGEARQACGGNLLECCLVCLMTNAPDIQHHSIFRIAQNVIHGSCSSQRDSQLLSLMIMLLMSLCTSHDTHTRGENFLHTRSTLSLTFSAFRVSLRNVYEEKCVQLKIFSFIFVGWAGCCCRSVSVSLMTSTFQHVHTYIFHRLHLRIITKTSLTTRSA